MHETLAKTSLGALEPGSRSTSSARSRPPPGSAATSCRATSTAPARWCGVRPSEHWELVEISLPAELERYLVAKGSITVDGISLTVVERRAPTSFTVSLIPETLARTTLGFKQPGDVVNLEVDVIAKYVEKMVRQMTEPSDRADPPRLASRRRSPTSPRARPWSSSTTRTARTRATSSSPPARRRPELMAFTIRHSSGVICVPMPADMLDRLEIPLMTPHNKDKLRTAYTISVDARDGVTTGISAADRAHTARVLADSATEPWEITRPGHVFPLRYREGGVLVRRGHTEAAVDLARMAGLTPAGVLVEVVNDDGTMKRGQRAARVRRRARPEDDLDRADGALPPPHRDPRRSASPRPRCRPATATSPRSATGSPSTAPSTSPWCTATRRRSATASRC